MNNKFPHKPYIERLPIVQYPKVLSANKNLAIVIPLFGDKYNTLGEEFSKTEFEMHVKSAVWTGMTLHKNSDLAANYVPIYFYIQEEWQASAEEILDAYDVPISDRLYFSVDWKGYALKTAPLGRKFAPIFHDALLEIYRHLLIIDSDIHLVSGEGIVPLYDKLYNDLTKYEFLFWSSEFKKYPHEDFSAIMNRGLGIETTAATMGEVLTKIGIPNSQYKLKLDEVLSIHLNSSLTLYPLWWWQEKLCSVSPYEFIREHYQRSGHDEDLLKVWYFHQQSCPRLSLEELIGVPQYFDDNAIIGHYENRCSHPYFAHIHQMDVSAPDRTDEYYDKLLSDMTRYF